jgi:hypothetical protein
MKMKKSFMVVLIFVTMVTGCTSTVSKKDNQVKYYEGDLGYIIENQSTITITGYRDTPLSGKEMNKLSLTGTTWGWLRDKTQYKLQFNEDGSADLNGIKVNYKKNGKTITISLSDHADYSRLTLTIINTDLIQISGKSRYRFDLVPFFIRKISSEENKLIIPSQIQGFPVTVIGERVFANCNITEVELPETLISIEKMAFRNNRLKSVSIPLNTLNVEDSVFTGNLLTSVSIPINLWANGEISSSAFDSNRNATVFFSSNEHITLTAFNDALKLKNEIKSLEEQLVRDRIFLTSPELAEAVRRKAQAEDTLLGRGAGNQTRRDYTERFEQAELRYDKNVEALKEKNILLVELLTKELKR